jgi:hypothetical protein
MCRDRVAWSLGIAAEKFLKKRFPKDSFRLDKPELPLDWEGTPGELAKWVFDTAEVAWAKWASLPGVVLLRTSELISKPSVFENLAGTRPGAITVYFPGCSLRESTGNELGFSGSFFHMSVGKFSLHKFSVDLSDPSVVRVSAEGFPFTVFVRPKVAEKGQEHV